MGRNAAQSERLLLFLAGDFPPDVGGIQRYVYELVRALVRRGEPCVVIAPRRRGCEGWDAALGCPVIRVAGRDKAGLALAMSRALRSVASRSRPSLVIATKWMPEGPAYLLARGRRLAPLALLGYGREFLPEQGRPVRAWAQRGVLDAVDVPLAISSYTRDVFVAAGVVPERVRVIHAGVDAAIFEGREDEGRQLRERLGLGDAPLLLTVGRLVPRKGHDLVVQALPEIARQVPGTRYAVVGEGPERRHIETLARSLPLGNQVIFAGAVCDGELPAWYAACNVFVMPSRDVPGEPPEGFGLVYLEANAAGKPVIATRTGGVAEAVVHGATGLLVETEDLEGLVTAAVRLLRDTDLSAQMGRTGRARVLHEFTWDRVADRFLAAVAEA